MVEAKDGLRTNGEKSSDYNITINYKYVRVTKDKEMT